MIKILLSLLVGTSLFSQTTCNIVIEKHSLEIGNWVSEYQLSNDLSKRVLKDNNLEDATEDDIWKYFLSSKTSKNTTSRK